MDYENTAKKILQRVGGKDNVINLVHCMTRLRFTLKDESIVDDEAVKKTKGVMGIMKKGGQYQIIIGNDVGNVFNELNKFGNFSNEVKEVPAKSNEKKNIFTMLMDTISGIMAPVIPAIIGAAMIKVLLTLLPMIGVLSTNGQTYQLLSVIGDGAFFFMPVLIAISASKKFGTNMYYAASIALIMLHPNLITLMNTAHDAGQTVKFLKYIPVTYASYSYSVIPIILAVYSLRYVERFVDKITPVVTKNFLKPMLGACIGGAVGGLVGGFFQMKCFGIATLIIGFEDIVDEDDDLDFVEESNAQLLDNEISITSPVEGKVIPLTEVKDPTFSQEILGKGAAIIPEKGVVYAPFDGKVDAVFETGHALGLVSEDGVELLVHVGIDTVNLKGKHFTPKKKSGDTMKKGDILLEFDIDKIKADGYDVTTPIIISNTEQFAKVKACEDKVVTKESKLLSVQ